MKFEEVIKAMTDREIQIEDVGLDHYGITYILDHYSDRTVDEQIDIILHTKYTITNKVHGEIIDCKNYADAMNTIIDIMESQDTCKVNKINIFEYEIIK